MNNDVPKKPRDAIIQAADKVGRSQGTCDRLSVGAVIWRDQGREQTIVAMGANSSPLGNSFSCDEDGHQMHEGHCIRTIHAETKAIVMAVSQIGEQIANGQYCIHVNYTPCHHCAKMAIQFGLSQITWHREYNNGIITRKVLLESNIKWGVVRY